MKAIRMAVVGAGSFGRHHVRHLSRHPRVARVCVVDRDGARARALAEAHGVETAADLGALTRDAVDAAVVAVPTEAHRSVAERLIARGIHVFVEKPIAATDGDAAALVAAADRARVALQVGHVERFSPVFQALCASARGVRHIAARRHNAPRPVPPTADVVLDLMIHDIDLALCLADAPVRDVAAFAPDGAGAEAATARLGFANGVVAELSASRLSPVSERTLTVHDATGVWHADLVAGTLARCADGAVAGDLTPEPHDNLAAELDTFVRAALGEGPPAVTGRAGAAALCVANRVRAALATSTFQLSA